MTPGINIRSFYRWIDRTIGLPDGATTVERVRARAIVVWSLLAAPGGYFIVLCANSFNFGAIPVICSLIGSAGMFAAVLHLSVTKNTLAASGIFVFSVLVGLGLGTWLTHDFVSINLVLLAVTPVFFGLIVDWRLCLKYTLCLMLYYALVFLTAAISESGNPQGLIMIAACAFSALGCGLSTVSYAHATSRAARKLTEKNKQIETLALTDPLTGVPNRRAFNQAVSNKVRASEPMMLALIDLNNFKTLNDRYGHDVGDEVLAAIAKNICNALPTGATFYRLGGDEFAALARANMREPELFAEILMACSGRAIETTGGRLKPTLSVGVSMPNCDELDSSKLFSQADTALYEAKKKTNAAWCVFDERLGVRESRNRELKDRMEIALQNDGQGIHILYQPQIDTSENRILGFEALARWRDETLGDVAPTEFIQVAEASGSISRLDRVILSKILGCSSAWLRADQTVAINVSAKTLVSAGFANFVKSEIEQHDLSPQQIQIEITETALIENKDLAKSVIDQLCKYGVSIALDDFGIGYSSLCYLTAFPIHRLKIDKSFLVGSVSEARENVLNAIVRLAESLKLEVIIEGVENQSHLQLVNKIGCPLVQGFYFARPLTPNQCLSFMAEHPRFGSENIRDVLHFPKRRSLLA